jgi:hypothetical protein
MGQLKQGSLENAPTARWSDDVRHAAVGGGVIVPWRNDRFGQSLRIAGLCPFIPQISDLLLRHRDVATSGLYRRHRRYKNGHGPGHLLGLVRSGFVLWCRAHITPNACRILTSADRALARSTTSSARDASRT